MRRKNQWYVWKMFWRLLGSPNWDFLTEICKKKTNWAFWTNVKNYFRGTSLNKNFGSRLFTEYLINKMWYQNLSLWLTEVNINLSLNFIYRIVFICYWLNLILYIKKLMFYPGMRGPPSCSFNISYFYRQSEFELN